jgi:hypothetical protein
VGIPERNSRLVQVMFPGSDALLSRNHSSDAGSAWLLNIAQEGSVELDAESLSGCPQALSKTEQFWPDTKSFNIVTCTH